MKTIVTTLNAKYIHRSLALRLLYTANRDRCDISFAEFTIKEDVGIIADKLLAEMPDIIGIGVYIWNVEKSRQLAVALKRARPDLTIILGGPEVSYEPEYFLENWPVDYIVSGEGEFVLGDLIEAISRGSTTQIDGISSKAYISKVVVQADLERIAAMPSPYTLPEDTADLAHRMIYFETSRGCPYQCQYCLSSLEKGVRYFPQEYIFNNLVFLIESGARKIKFLDRTFNLNKKHTRAIFDFLIAQHREGLSCQFEIYADLLTDEVTDDLNNNLPANYFRFEIGIQSTHEPTNIAVKRKQDFPLLAENILKLMSGGKIDLHLDLIAGLPYETFPLFIRSFNDVFAFRAKELQLGFLKMLRGTALRKNAAKHGYIYSSEAPYQVNSNNYISAKELERIHIAEHALERYWNSGRFSQSMAEIFNIHYAGRYFEFFDELGLFTQNNHLPHHGYQLEDLFRNLNDFLIVKGINIPDSLRRDYYSCFTIRPKGSFLAPIDKQLKKRLIHQILDDIEFSSDNGLTEKILKKNCALDILDNGNVFITLFDENSNLKKEIRYRCNVEI